MLLTCTLLVNDVDVFKSFHFYRGIYETDPNSTSYLMV